MFPGGRRHRMDLAPKKKRQRKDIVASSRAARAAREREKLEARSATAIQAFWRGRSAAQAVRASQRRVWDETKQVDLPRFLFFYRHTRRDDHDRLRRVAALTVATKATFPASLERRLLRLCVPFIGSADEKAIVLLFVVLLTRHTADTVPNNRTTLCAVRDGLLEQRDDRLRGMLFKAVQLFKQEPFYTQDVVAWVPDLPPAALPDAIPLEALTYVPEGGTPGLDDVGDADEMEEEDEKSSAKVDLSSSEDDDEDEHKASGGGRKNKKKKKKQRKKIHGILLRNLVPCSRKFVAFLTALMRRSHEPLDVPALPLQSLPTDERFLDVYIEHARDPTAVLDWICYQTSQHGIELSLESSLSLYCACTSHMLFTMAHSDFLKQKESMTKLVVELNAVLQRLFHQREPLSADDMRLRRRGTRTFAQLRDRQSRQQFCAPELFQFATYDDEVLAQLPFAVPFVERARRFTEEVRADRDQAALVAHHVNVSVERAHVLEQGFLRLYGQPLKTASIRVQFEGEPGIDGGGLYKEFVLELLKEGFNRFFCETVLSKRLYPDPEQRDWAYLSFLGSMVGKAVSDGITIEPQLAHFFLRKILGQWNSLEDLLSLDPDLYKNLRYLTTCSSEEIDELNVTFPGTDEPVTKANRVRYLYTIADKKLNRDIRRHTNAFIDGLSKIVPLRLLQSFTADELGRLISGDTSIDMADLRQHTVYTSYSPHSEVITWFWDIVENEMDTKHQSLLLRFATSCSRSPLMGFGTLDPKFCIQRTHSSADALPTASTCMNLLRLPDYPSKDVLRDRLLTAITEGNSSGFQLS